MELLVELLVLCLLMQLLLQQQPVVVGFVGGGDCSPFVGFSGARW